MNLAQDLHIKPQMNFFKVKTMEVKDINNNATIQAMFAKAVAGAAAGQALGSGFANLINQVADVVSSSSGSDGAKASAKNQSVDNKASAASDKVDAKKDKPARKARPAAEKADKPAARQNDRKQPAPEAVPLQTAQNAAAPDEVKPAAGAGDAAAAVAEDAAAPVVQPVEGAEPVSHELKVTLAGAGASDFVAMMNGGEMVLLPQGMDLSALAALPVVNVLDQATGEVVSMSGAEFAARVQGASDGGSLFMVDENSSGKFVDLIPAEVKADVERQFGSAKADAAQTEQGAPLADELLAEQAVVLDGKLGRDQKVKLNVEVKEEKISYADGADLVQDKVALDEVIKAAAEEKSADAGAKLSSVKSPLSAQPQAAQPVVNNNLQAAPAAPAAVAGTEIQTAAETAKSAVVEGVSATGSDNSAALGTAAVAGNVRAEAKSQAGETSFRDIYKGMSKEVIDQVKVNITKSAVKGVDNIEIKLKPQDLGQIEIKMQISKDGKLQAHIVSSRPETMEILQKEVQNLEKAFQDAGFQTDEGSLSFSFREGGESGREQDRNSELRNFIGNVLEHDTTEELGSNDNLLGWNPAQGLNIRV